MIKNNNAETEYENLLGMFGLVLNQVGGKVEVPYTTVLNFDAAKYQVLSQYNQATNVFTFELVKNADE